MMIKSDIKKDEKSLPEDKNDTQKNEKISIQHL